MDLTVTAGLLVRGQMRRYLEEAMWDRHISEYKELKGFLESRFLVRGANKQVAAQIDAWVKDANTQAV